MITEFGKLLRKLRIDESEVLGDMAAKLEISSAYLSAIEIGKREIPETLIPKLQRKYSLNQELTNKLFKAKENELKKIFLNLDGTENQKRDAALVFARNFDSMDINTAKDIISLLRRSEDAKK